MGSYDFDMDGDIGIGDGDEQVKSNKLDWYQMKEKDVSQRVAVVYFNPYDVTQLRALIKQKPELSDDQKKLAVEKIRGSVAAKLNKAPDALDLVDMLDLSAPRFKALDASYKEGVGYAQWPKVLSEADKVVWSKLPEKKTYVTTLLLVYPCDREGDIDNDRLAKSWRVIPWRFSPDKYEMIKRINKKVSARGESLATQDLLLTCKEPKFQNILVEDAGPAVWLKHDKLKRQVLEKAVTLYSKLNPFKEMTTEELREKLGLPSSGGGGSSSIGSDTNYDDVLKDI